MEKLNLNTYEIKNLFDKYSLETLESLDLILKYTKNYDLNSTNGVYVNNEKINEKVKLIADDEIKIGSAIFKVLKSSK